MGRNEIDNSRCCTVPKIVGDDVDFAIGVHSDSTEGGAEINAHADLPVDLSRAARHLLLVLKCPFDRSMRSIVHKKIVKKTIRASVPIEKIFSGFFFLRKNGCSQQTQIKPNGGSTAAGL